MTQSMPLRCCVVLAAVALGLTLATCAPAQTGPLPDPATFRTAPDDVIETAEEVDNVGRWMITRNLENVT